MKLKVDSRQIEKGDVFLALKGVDSDGHDYIESAIKNGTSKIIAEHGSYSVETQIVPDTREYLSNYLKDYYKDHKSIIPIYSITFGDANERQLEKIADLTNAKVFNGKDGLLAAFREVRSYN